MPKGKIYSRRTNSRREKPIVLIVPEGTETEKLYFQHFNSREKRIRVEIVENTSGGAKTDYSSLLKKAIALKKKLLLSAAKGDSVWVVADGDVDYNTPGSLESKDNALVEARTMAEKSGVTILISNPCFELWYYLHGAYSTGFMRDYQSVIDKFPSSLTGYAKNKDVFDLLSDQTDIAIARAKQLESFHKDNGETMPFSLSVNPFSEVFRLVEMIK